MRLLLVHPPMKVESIAMATESLGLGYIASTLRKDGHEVEILDAHIRCLNTGSTIKEILNRDFDCLGITAMHPHKDILIRIAREIKKRRGDVVIMAGGYLPSLAAEQLLKICPEIDFIVMGEGEHTTSEVIRRIEHSDDWRACPGVACISDGRFVFNQPPPLIKDLDSVPFPARDSIRMPSVSESIMPMVASSRGCHHNCSFCCINSFYLLSGGRVPRRRSPSNFVDEIEQVLVETGRKNFAFVDDNFIGPGKTGQEHAAAIADEIRGRKLDIGFIVQFRPDEVNEDTLRALKEAGLTGLFLGIESGSQRQLDTFNKGVSVEDNARAIEIVKRVGIPLELNLIMFDPYTTVDELQENLEFARKYGDMEGRITPKRLRLYHGIPLTERLREDGLLIENGLDLDYNFQNPAIKLAWHVTNISDNFAKFTRRLRESGA